MSNTADVTGGKSIAVWSQSVSGVSASNLLVAFYDIHRAAIGRAESKKVTFSGTLSLPKILSAICIIFGLSYVYVNIRSFTRTEK
jgi:hypothetical protein